MSEHEALIAAVRAEEQARSAHHRLDRMNGSIDKMRGAIQTIEATLSAKLDAVLIHQATTLGFTDGEKQAQKGFLESRRFVIGTLVALVGAVATIIWLKAGG